MNTKLTKHQSQVYDAFTSIDIEEFQKGVKAWRVIEQMEKMGYSTSKHSYSVSYERVIARTLVNLAQKGYIQKVRFKYTEGPSYHSFWRFFLNGQDLSNI